MKAMHLANTCLISEGAQLNSQCLAQVSGVRGCEAAVTEARLHSTCADYEATQMTMS